MNRQRAEARCLFVHLTDHWLPTVVELEARCSI